MVLVVSGSRLLPLAIPIPPASASATTVPTGTISGLSTCSDTWLMSQPQLPFCILI